ncbi:MAG: glycosyl hydrolase [Armatimonadota bacterium]
MITLAGQYFLNHRLDPEEIRWQVRELAEAGYQAIYPHARQGLLTPYMSEDWWRALEVIAQVCRETGMQMWIWDEDYFPSGLAGGRVVWEDLGLVARGLVFSVEEVQGEGPFELDFADGHLLRCHALPLLDEHRYGDPLDITRFCGTRRQRWTERWVNRGAYSPLIGRVGPPHRRTTMRENRYALSWRPEEPGRYLIVATLVDRGGGRRHPDILRPEGIARFIELSYEPYFERWGEEFGELIGAAFTDEPSPGGPLYPWSGRFPEQFAADHGYDILQVLPHLALDIDERSPAVRHHYRLTQGRLQREHYVGQIARWCEEHGIAMSGHLTRQEWLQLVAVWWPNEVRCYRQMHIPACDPLGAAAGWPDAAAYHSGVKAVSSAAHLFGREQCSTDCLAVLGDAVGLRDLKYLLDYQMVLGINHVTIHGLDLSLDGPRKYETPPSLFYQHTQWRHMDRLLAHVREMCEALTGGRHLCELAVLYPSTMLGAIPTPGFSLSDPTHERPVHELVEKLLSHQRDFDFIDEITLAESVDEEGAISTPEPYRTIILPHLRWIDEEAAEALARFAEGGGRVIAVGRMPQALTHDPDRPQHSWADDGIELMAELDQETLDSLPGAEVVGEGARDVFVCRREVDGERRTFALNRREDPFEGSIDGVQVGLPERGSALIRRQADGTVRVIPEAARCGATVADLSRGWRVEFEANHVPLSLWHVGPADEGQRGPFTALPAVDLIERTGELPDEGSDELRYHCRFMLTGEIPDARLVMDGSAIGGQWCVRVNGAEVTHWRRETVYDCRNRVAEVGHLLRGGSVPTLNVVTVTTSGEGRGLFEALNLYGSFACELRHEHRSMPFLAAEEVPLRIDTLHPWDALGRPTFSGAAVYRRRLAVEEAGGYTLDLGRVEDCAAVSIDGEQVAVLPWPPYRCRLQLAAGEHELAVEVINPPANRNWAAGMTAGLLGPVRLCRAR